jgi:hypothetical protein
MAMKKVLEVVAFCLLGCGLMWAEPPQCKQATLAHYISLGAEGCKFGNVVFANFKYSGSAKGGADGGGKGGATTIAAGQIVVEPILIPTETPSFEFSAHWGAASAQSQDSVI